MSSFVFISLFVTATLGAADCKMVQDERLGEQFRKDDRLM